MDDVRAGNDANMRGLSCSLVVARPCGVLAGLSALLETELLQPPFKVRTYLGKEVALNVVPLIDTYLFSMEKVPLAREVFSQCTL